jgi:hypothetical protein
MIREETEHLTELDAKSKGEAFKTAWGWGYDATYQTYYNETKSVWVCATSRYSSCD